MHSPAVVIGLGEIGSVMARGLMRIGIPVYPLLRDTPIAELAEHIPAPLVTIVAVAENDLHPLLDRIPESWKKSLVLLQNELLPKDWQAHQLSQPTVISVWFEKKKGQDFKVLVPSPVFGPKAQTIIDALNSLDIPTAHIHSESDMLLQLVIKNVYILTTNIAGLITKGTVEDLWYNHQQLAHNVASDVIDIQEWLTRATFDRQQLMDGMLKAIQGDPQHRCMGRSAPARLANAIANADNAKLEVVKLREIYANQT